MSARNVFCRKMKKEMPGLEKPPFPGETGVEIYENISAEAWEMWKEMQLKVINEYRLNMGEKSDYEMLMQQMLLFLNLREA